MKVKLLYTGILNVILLLFTQAALAQQDEVSDSSLRKIDIEPTLGKKDYDDRGETITYPRTYGGLSFTRIDWGFSRLIDGGSFTLGAESQFLAYSKASNFGFDIAQFGVRFNDAFKVYISTGFEWNYLRLKNDIILDTEATPLAYRQADITYKKNILTSTYLRVPLSFEWRGSRDRHGRRPKFAFGAMTGILLKGTQRLKSKEQGKQKFKDNYNLASFQYGPFVRVGYGPIGIFSKYYMSDLFENSPNHENLHNLTFGLTLGF